MCFCLVFSVWCHFLLAEDWLGSFSSLNFIFSLISWMILIVCCWFQFFILCLFVCVVINNKIIMWEDYESSLEWMFLFSCCFLRLDLLFDRFLLKPLNPKRLENNPPSFSSDCWLVASSSSFSSRFSFVLSDVPPSVFPPSVWSFVFPPSVWSSVWSSVCWRLLISN